MSAQSSVAEQLNFSRRDLLDLGSSEEEYVELDSIELRLYLMTRLIIVDK